MSPEHITWAWLAAGIALIAAEVVVPGAILVFLGAGAVGVAGLRWVGLLDGWSDSFTAWFVISTVLLITLRGLVARLSRGEQSFQSANEDVDALGAVVTVATRLTDGDFSGRIRFRGTTWPARSVRGALEPGAQVRIIDRDNLSWIVEKV